jgi:hypothetical protein
MVLKLGRNHTYSIASSYDISFVYNGSTYFYYNMIGFIFTTSTSQAYHIGNLLNTNYVTWGVKFEMILTCS